MQQLHDERYKFSAMLSLLLPAFICWHQSYATCTTMAPLMLPWPSAASSLQTWHAPRMPMLARSPLHDGACTNDVVILLLTGQCHVLDCCLRVSWQTQGGSRLSSSSRLLFSGLLLGLDFNQHGSAATSRCCWLLLLQLVVLLLLRLACLLLRQETLLLLAWVPPE